MNTSTNTNQILRRGMAGALLATAITATAVGLAAAAHADDAPSLGGPAHVGPDCQTDPWGFLGSQRRTLCDGPISSDGSWSRERTIWAPAHYSTPICSYRGGSSSSSYTSCSGGYFVNERLIGNETYPVRPDTVLPDEPGHLG
jgi:hypothetical protein